MRERGSGELSERDREREKESGWVGMAENIQKTHKDKAEKEKHCLQGSSISFITMRCYRGCTVIKVTLTVLLEAVYRYSSRAEESRRNLDDKVKDNEVINI